MLDKLDAEFAFGRQALDVRAYRQELLSSNIANADTPGYQARDVDFASTLARSLKQTSGGLAPSNAAQLPMAQPAGVASGMTMVSTAPGHMAGTAKLIPTGGVTLETAASFLKAGARALGVGSDLVNLAAIDAGKPELITQAARDYLAVVAKARGAKG